MQFVYTTSETSALAMEAAKKVKVTYSEVRPPILTIEDSLAKGKEFVDRRKTIVIGNPDGKMHSVNTKDLYRMCPNGKKTSRKCKISASNRAKNC